MRKILLGGFWVLLLASLILGSWHVVHGDIQYSSDIARDFLLLEQIHQKAFVLIGPNSSTGLFHGVLWMYLNYPIYALSGGNPVAIGWFWVFLGCLFVGSGFFIADRLFGRTTAYLYTLMIALYTVFHVSGLYNPHGAMFVLPAVFFFFVRYLQTKKIKFLLLHVLFLGVTIQFQMAIGIPFTILSFLYIVIQSFLWKKYVHALSFLLIPVTLFNFILFDLRHQFLLTHLVLRFLTSAGRDHINIFSMLWQRFIYLTSGVEFFRENMGYRNVLAALVFVFFLCIQFKDKKHVLIYKSFLYFYIGFFFLSNLNAGGLLYFYLFPLFPLVFLPFVSFVTSRYKVVFLVIFFLIYAVNFLTAVTDMKQASGNTFGKAQDSWKFYEQMTSHIFHKETAFGYFVYSPDVVAYQGKYAMFYQQKHSPKQAYYFQKKNVTYLVVAPPPADNPFMHDRWWTQNLLHIAASPSATTYFENGYKVEKYLLSNKQQQIPTEANIDPGIAFR